MLRELQRTGELSSEIDVRGIPHEATLEEAGLDPLARHTLAAMIEDILDLELDHVDDAGTTIQELVVLLQDRAPVF
jgi:hypothetical protein